MRASGLFAAGVLATAALTIPAAAVASSTYSTRVASFSVPATREAHQTFTVSGVAQVWNGSAWTSADGIIADYYYRFQGQTNWHFAGSAQADPNGHFSSLARVSPGHTIWQIRIPKQTAGDVYLASSSGTENSFITDRTYSRVIAVDIPGSRTIVSGWVRDWAANGQQTFGNIVGRYVKVYYHPRGTTRWGYLGEVRTGAGGSVTFTAYRALHGYFRVVFPASGYYLGSTSNSYYRA